MATTKIHKQTKETTTELPATSPSGYWALCLQTPHTDEIRIDHDRQQLWRWLVAFVREQWEHDISLPVIPAVDDHAVHAYFHLAEDSSYLLTLAKEMQPHAAPPAIQTALQMLLGDLTSLASNVADLDRGDIQTQAESMATLIEDLLVSLDTPQT